MSMKPPRDATPLDPETVAALDLVVPPRTPKRYAPEHLRAALKRPARRAARKAAP